MMSNEGIRVGELHMFAAFSGKSKSILGDAMNDIMDILSIGKPSTQTRACFCVGKVLGCTCGGRCRCDCSCTEAQIKDDHSAHSWSEVVKDSETPT